MLLTEKHIIKKGNIHYDECASLCLKSKNIYNYANYIVRQEFIKTSKEKQEGLLENANYLNYHKIRKILIKHESYTSLPRKVSNQTLMMLDRNWNSFFKSIKDWKKNPSKYMSRPSLPKYKNTKKGEYIVIYEKGAISKKELKNNVVKLSDTNIRISSYKQNIKQCRIIPNGSYYTIEIIYEYKEEKLKEDNKRYCSIDLGINNLATVTSNVVAPFAINGRPIKSFNQYYNKNIAKLKSIAEVRNGVKTTNKIKKLGLKRKNKINNYFHKASRYIINHLVSNNINTLVIGYNKTWKQEINIGSVNNQKFVSIPFQNLINMLIYKAKLQGINVILNEESYTSKCSFFDQEEIKKHEIYLGKRIKRGLFKTLKGMLVNADVNGSYNILKKVYPDAFADGVEGLAVHPKVITLK
jgi:putative transposase